MMTGFRFTSTALGVIRCAQEQAVQLGHCYVGSEHLLLGLLGQEYSAASRFLTESVIGFLSREQDHPGDLCEIHIKSRTHLCKTA